MGFIILSKEVLLQKEEKFSLKNRLPVEKGVKNELHWNTDCNPGQPVYTVELQWLEHLWNHEHVFETEVVQANEC